MNENRFSNLHYLIERNCDFC